MSILKILLFIFLGIIGINLLFFLASIILIQVRMGEFAKKDKLLRAYGYHWDTESNYWINDNLEISIPYAWFLDWDFNRLYEYLERRASHDNCS